MARRARPYGRKGWTARKTFTADVEATCGRCRQPIPAGARHYRDRTGSPEHPDCTRHNVVTERVVRPMMRPNLSDVGKPCAVCTVPIDADELPVPHRGGYPLHKGCL